MVGQKTVLLLLASISLSTSISLNSKCRTTSDCGLSTFLTCNQGACNCPDSDNQLFDPVLQKCINLVGTTCDSQFKSGPPCVSNSECIDMVCTCRPGFTPFELSYCRPDFGIPCSKSIPCDDTRGMTCATDEKRCRCKEGMVYMESYGACFLKTTRTYLANMEKAMAETGIMELVNSMVDEFNAQNEIGYEQEPRTRVTRDSEDDLTVAAQNTVPIFSNPQFGGNPRQPSFLRNLFQTIFNPNGNNGRLPGQQNQNPLFSPPGSPAQTQGSEFPQPQFGLGNNEPAPQNDGIPIGIPNPQTNQNTVGNQNQRGLFGNLGNLFRSPFRNLGLPRAQQPIGNNPGLFTRFIRSLKNLINTFFNFLEGTTTTAENTTRGLISRVRQSVSRVFPFLQGLTGIRRDNMFGQCACNRDNFGGGVGRRDLSDNDNANATISR